MEIPASVIMSSGIHIYVAVKASLHATDSSVFGLNPTEINAISKRFNSTYSQVINGVMIKAPPMQMINALGELGYKVIGTTGDAEIVWTMERESH